MNDLLKIEYEKYLKSLKNNFSSDEAEQLSLPLLMHVFPAYLEAKIKILFVGQETNGWAYSLNKLDEFNTSFLVNKYEGFRFGKGDDKYSSPIFQFMINISQQLNSNQIIDGFLWTSFSKLSYIYEGRSSYTTPPIILQEKDLEGFKLLVKEIEITKPDVLIFTTGNKYQDKFNYLWKDLKKEKIELSNKKLKLEKLTHPDLPKLTFICNNPPSLRFVKGNNIDKINKLIEGMKLYI